MPYVEVEDSVDRSIRVVFENGVLYLDLCEDDVPAYRMPMGPHDAIGLAKALVTAVGYLREQEPPVVQ